MAEKKKNTSAKSTSAKSSAKKATTKSSTTKTTNKPKTTTKKTTTSKAKTTTKKPVVKKEVKEIKEVVPVVEKEVKVETKTKKVKKEKTPIMEVIKANATLIFLCLICALLIVNIVLIALGHKVKLSDGKEIVASIDGREITADELYESVKETHGTNELINMIDETIIKKEIEDTTEADKNAKEQVESIKKQYESMNYKWDEVLTNYGYESEQVLVDEIKNSLLKEKIVTNYISKNLTDEEVEKYYNENIEDTYTAKHILITPDTTDGMTDEQKQTAEAAALATANEVITKLNNGEAWATLVSTYSEDTGSKSSEGLIENFTKGEVVDEFFNATKGLEDGKYTTTPVKSKFGYHIILRVSKTEKEALENMKDELKNEIVSSKLNNDSNLYNTTWAEIRKNYNLKINDTTIESYYNKAVSGK